MRASTSDSRATGGASRPIVQTARAASRIALFAVVPRRDDHRRHRGCRLRQPEAGRPQDEERRRWPRAWKGRPVASALALTRFGCGRLLGPRPCRLDFAQLDGVSARSDLAARAAGRNAARRRIGRAGGTAGTRVLTGRSRRCEREADHTPRSSERGRQHGHTAQPAWLPGDRAALRRALHTMPRGAADRTARS